MCYYTYIIVALALLPFILPQDNNTQCSLCRVDFDRILFCCDVTRQGLICATVSNSLMTNHTNSSISRINSDTIKCENFNNLYYCCQNICQPFSYLQESNMSLIESNNSLFQGINLCFNFNTSLVCTSYRSQGKLYDGNCYFESDSQFCCPVDNNSTWCIVNTKDTRSFVASNLTDSLFFHNGGRDKSNVRSNYEEKIIPQDLEQENVKQIESQACERNQKSLSDNVKINRLGYSFLRYRNNFAVFLRLIQRRSQLFVHVLGLELGTYVVHIGTTTVCGHPQNDSREICTIDSNRFRIGNTQISQFIGDLSDFRGHPVFIMSQNDPNNVACGTLIV